MSSHQLHYSMLDTYSKCGEQYRRRYIEKDIIPPGIALAVGKATDVSVTKDLQHKIDNGRLLKIDVVKQVAFETFQTEYDAGIRITKADLDGKSVLDFKGANADKAVRLSTLHHEVVAPKLKPTHVQREWAIDLGLDVDIVGTIDVQETRPGRVGHKVNDVVGILDTKTAGKSPPADQADKSLQLTTYAFAVKVLDGKMPDYVGLNYLVDNKVPVAKMLRSVRTEEDFEPLLRRIEHVIMGTKRAVFMPAREEDWWCSPRWCGYHDTCQYVKHQVSEVVQIQL